MPGHTEEFGNRLDRHTNFLENAVVAAAGAVAQKPEHDAHEQHDFGDTEKCILRSAEDIAHQRTPLRLMIGRELHDHAASVLGLDKTSAEDLCSDPHMQEHRQQQKHDDQRSACAEKDGGEHWDDRPCGTAGNRPCQCNGEHLLSPVVDDSRARCAAHCAAEADKERHDGFALQAELPHRVVKHIGDTRHDTDFLQQSEHQCDTEHKAEHLHHIGHGLDEDITHESGHEIRSADRCQQTGDRGFERRQSGTDRHQRERRDKGCQETQHHRENDCRLAPESMRVDAVELAECRFRSGLIDCAVKDFVDPCEFALSRC